MPTTQSSWWQATKTKRSYLKQTRAGEPGSEPVLRGPTLSIMLYYGSAETPPRSLHRKTTTAFGPTAFEKSVCGGYFLFPWDRFETQRQSYQSGTQHGPQCLAHNHLGNSSCHRGLQLSCHCHGYFPTLHLAKPVRLAPEGGSLILCSRGSSALLCAC